MPGIKQPTEIQTLKFKKKKKKKKEKINNNNKKREMYEKKNSVAFIGYSRKTPNV